MAQGIYQGVKPFGFTNSRVRELSNESIERMDSRRRIIMGRLVGPQNWIVLEAYCPKCRNYWGDDIFTNQRTRKESRGRVPEGDMFECAECPGRFEATEQLVARNKGVKALSDTYKRRDHFTYQVKGADHTNFSIAPALEKQGVVLPKNFNGSSDELAVTLRMSHRDLSSVWQMSEAELRGLGSIRITH